MYSGGGDAALRSGQAGPQISADEASSMDAMRLYRVFARMAFLHDARRGSQYAEGWLTI